MLHVRKKRIYVRNFAAIATFCCGIFPPRYRRRCVSGSQE
ncbi:hypothetical protein OOU_Y34scaffold00433g1 [Pyricularia oryzae Y34]|nr:hypothetical protein OOU_Y34scaffold00433g1 [Pyricularia oryzae Y34]